MSWHNGVMLGGRCEEAELAAGVGMRRAATAEAEAEQLRLSLMEAQKQAKDLGWQVRAPAASSASSLNPKTLKEMASEVCGVRGSDILRTNSWTKP